MENRINPYAPPQHAIDNMMAEQDRVPVEFWLYVGNAGNCKSLMLNRHILAWFAWTEEIGTYNDCYSTLRVKTPEWWEGKPRETKDLELTDLAKSIRDEKDDDAIVSELEKMHDCMIAIDEMQNWADRQNWQSVKSRLFNYILMQRRHQHLYIAGTIQNRMWLNRRTDYQIDFEVICQSMHKFPREEHIANWERIPGQYTQLRIRDLSGLVRPYSWYEDHYEKIVRVGPNWPIFNTYSTYQNQDVFEPFRKLAIKGKKQEFSMDGDDPVDVEFSDVKVPGNIGPEVEEKACIHILEQCLNAGCDMIICDDFRDMYHEQGLKTDPARIGRMLAKYNVTKRKLQGKWVYDLSNVPIREAVPA